MEPDRISLWRAVDERELADILATGKFRLTPGLECKYFALTPHGAAEYSRQAHRAWPASGSYTLVQTSMPSDLIEPAMRVTVDIHVAAVVVPGPLLEQLGPMTVLDYMPLPGR